MPSKEKNHKKSSLVLKVFPTPKYLKMPSVGLDITSDSIRFVRLEKTKHGLVPKKFEEVVLKTPCDLTKVEEDSTHGLELTKELIALRKKYHFTFAAVSLSEANSYIFKTIVPKEAEDNLVEAVSFKLEENVPLNPNDVVVDFDRIYEHKNLNQIELVVTAVAANVISARTKILKEAGIIPKRFVTEAQAVAKAVVPKDDSEPYLLIHPNKAGTVLSVVDDNVVQYVSWVAAPSDAVVANFDGPEATMLREQINKVLIYWFTNKHDVEVAEKVEMAIVTGPYADNESLIKFLNTSIKISVQKGNVWQNAFNVNDYVPPIQYKESLKYAVAVGLALY